MRVEELVNVERSAGKPTEIELANFIISKLDDPRYAPSKELLQAIRAVTKKLEGDSPLHGVIRTF